MTNETPQPLDCLKVLIAEDDADIRELIERELTDAGATVTSVENGEQAVQSSTTQNFDVLLFDVEMPKLDGLSVAEYLRRRGSRLPMIAISAHDLPGDLLNAHVAGFSAHISKPFQNGELVNTILKFWQPPGKN